CGSRRACRRTSRRRGGPLGCRWHRDRGMRVAYWTEGGWLIRRVRRAAGRDGRSGHPNTSDAWRLASVVRLSFCMRLELLISGMLAVHAKHAVFAALAGVEGIARAEVELGRAELEVARPDAEFAAVAVELRAAI